MVAGCCVVRNRGAMIEEHYVAARFANVVDWDRGKE